MHWSYVDSHTASSSYVALSVLMCFDLSLQMCWSTCQLRSSLVTKARGRLVLLGVCTSFLSLLGQLPPRCTSGHFELDNYRLVKTKPADPYFLSVIVFFFSVCVHNVFAQAWQEEMVLTGLNLAEKTVLVLPLKVAIFSHAWFAKSPPPSRRLFDNNGWLYFFFWVETGGLFGSWWSSVCDSFLLNSITLAFGVYHVSDNILVENVHFFMSMLTKMTRLALPIQI